MPSHGQRATAFFRLSCLGFLLATLVGDSMVSAQHTAIKVMGTTLRNYLLVVPVTINGVGPFQFIVDTGSSITVLNDKTASKLGLTASAFQRMSGIMPQAHARRTSLRELSVSGACVHNLVVVSMKLEIPLAVASVDGILGENFLDQFDVYLEHQSGTLWLDQGEELTRSFGGVRLSLSTVSRIGAETFHHRPVLEVTVPSYQKEPVTVVLDSAAQALTLFPRSTGRTVSRFPDQAFNTSVTVFGGHLECASWSGDLLWKQLLLSRNSVVVCPRLVGESLDAEGNLPSAIFKSVLLAHRHDYVIFNPDRLP